jgi:hypothetical protein
MLNLNASQKCHSIDGALRYEHVAAVFKTPKGCIDVISVAQQSQVGQPDYTPPRRHSVCDRYIAASHLVKGVKPLPSPGFTDILPDCGLMRNEILEKIPAQCPLFSKTHHVLRVWLLELVDQGPSFEKVGKGGDLFENAALLRKCVTINDAAMLQRAFSAGIDVITVYLRDSQSSTAGKLLLSSLYTGSRFQVPKFPNTMPDNRPPVVKDGPKRPPVTATAKKNKQNSRLDYRPVRKHFFDRITDAVPRGCSEVRRVGGSAREAVMSPETVGFLRKQRGALPRSRFGVSAVCLLVRAVVLLLVSLFTNSHS